jgi:DNA-binding CsgD family transcriptional regulator
MGNVNFAQENPNVDIFFEQTSQRFSLTKREGEVLKLLSLKGTTYRELSDELQLSENTLRNHVVSIQGKLNAKSRSEIQAIIFRDYCLAL